MNLLKLPIFAAVLLVLAACGPTTSDIRPAKISPTQYRDYDCAQISLELQRVTSRAATFQGELDPLEAYEYAQLTGERNALTQAATQKGCSTTSPAN